MSSQPRSWLTVEFVQRILRNAESDDSIEVINIASKAATASGDNYMSDMLRTAVEYSRDRSGQRVMEKKSLIVKIQPNRMNSTADMIKKGFETEIEMMGKTLIKMNDVLNEKDYRLSPHCLYTNIGDPTILVMEDLEDLGFRMADRHTRLDLDHCILAMRGLAKFHGSSVAICEKDPKSKPPHMSNLFSKDNPEELKQFCKNGIKIVSKEVANWAELDPSYSEKLLKLSEVCYEKGAKCVKRKDDEFNVIIHGDYWINNMLFRYDDTGKVVDHIFIDFQTCAWNSPAIDISHFLSLSPLDEVLEHHRDALLHEYHNVLSQTMSRLGCKQKPPSMESLQKSLKEREFLIVMASCLGLPFMLVDKKNVMDFDEMISHGSDYVNPAYKTQAYREIMLKRLIAWNSRGLLDC